MDDYVQKQVLFWGFKITLAVVPKIHQLLRGRFSAIK